MIYIYIEHRYFVNDELLYFRISLLIIMLFDLFMSFSKCTFLDVKIN